MPFRLSLSRVAPLVGKFALPYLAFVEVLRGYALSQEAADLAGEFGVASPELCRIVPELRDKLQVAPRASHDPEEQRWRLLNAVVDALRVLAERQALLLVLEDLHWADRGTLDMLLHLARNLSGSRLLVLGTYRDVEVDRAHPLSGVLADLRRGGWFDRIVLRGLTVDEVHRLYEETRGNEVPREQAELVHSQTEGNPLFVQEVLRYLVEEGLVVRQGGRYVYVSDRPVATVLPEGLRDAVGSRLNRLSEGANQMLAAASVIGRQFTFDVLRAVARLPEDRLIDALEEGLQGGIIEELTRPGVIEYRFAHSFFRQALYEEMSAPRRLRLHQLVAKALEEGYADRPEEHAAELAEHFSNSTDGVDLAKAVAYGELAARRAMDVFALADAVRILERVLEMQDALDPEDKHKLCDLYLALGHALMPAGDPRRASAYASARAFSLAEALEDGLRAFEACRIGLEGAEIDADGRITPAWLGWLERAEVYAHVSPAARARFSRAKAREFVEPIADLFEQSDESVARVKARQTVHPGRGKTAAGVASATALLEEALGSARALGDPETEFSLALDIEPLRDMLTRQLLQGSRQRPCHREVGIEDTEAIRAAVAAQVQASALVVVVDGKPVESIEAQRRSQPGHRGCSRRACAHHLPSTAVTSASAKADR